MSPTPLPSTAIRHLAAVLGLLALPLAGYNLYLDVVAADGAFTPGVLYTLLMALASTTAGGLAVLVALRARATPANRVFALFLGALALGVAVEQGVPAVPRAWSAALYHALVATGLAATLRLSQLFPRPLDPAAVRAAPGPRRLRMFQARAMGPGPAWLGVGVGGWLLLVAAYSVWRSSLAVLLQMALVLVVLTIATSYLRVAYARGDDADRGRIFWFIEAGLITIGALVLGSGVEVSLHAYGNRSPLVLWTHAMILPLGLLGMVVVFAIAALYKGAVDSRLVVRQTLVYGAIGFLLTLVFVAIETLVEEVLATRLGLPDRAGGYIAGLTAALVFGPLRGWIERAIGARPVAGRKGEGATQGP